MESNKNLHNEHIAQQFESLKALTKAFVAKEVAERTSGDNSVLGMVNRRLEGIDQLFDSKLKDEVKIMTEKLDTQSKDIEVEKVENAKSRKDMADTLEKVQALQGDKL